MTAHRVTLPQYLDRNNVDLRGGFLREEARLITQMMIELEVESRSEHDGTNDCRCGPTRAMATVSGLGEPAWTRSRWKCPS
jgi:hypothetical protein